LNLGLSTISLRHSTLEEALDAARTLGFDYVDIASIPGFAPHLNPLSKDAARSLMVATEGRGLVVASLNVGGDLASPVTWGEATRFIRSAVEVAADARIPLVTVAAGGRTGSLQLAAKNLKEVVSVGRGLGVEVTVEVPHMGTLAQTWRETLELLRNLPDATTTLDTSHLHASGASLRDLPVKERMSHVHLRDARGPDISLVPGEGEFDFKGFFRAMKPFYRGVYTLELEMHERGAEAVIEKIRRAKRFIVSAYAP